MARIAADDNSERKRISIPKADDSVLAWWDVQKDAALSVRLLIRNEIERNGYTDAAYRPVAQLPRRGRPPGVGVDGVEDADGAEDIGSYATDAPVLAPAVAPVPAPVVPAAVAESVAAPVAPTQAPVPATAAAPAPVRAPAQDPVPVRELQPVAAGGRSAIDDIMNG
jgi:hypothetical protein